MSPRLRDRRDLKERPEPENEIDLESFTLSSALGALDPAVEGVESPGLGSWTFFYRLGWKPTTDRQRAGLRAMKVALVNNGYAKGIDVDMEVFGDAVTNRTKDFQRAHALIADGVIGPNTARALFHLYYAAVEEQYGIPDNLLAKTGYGESNDDPIAEGVIDKDDEGILQFHLPYWPGVTLAQAWDPQYEIARAGEKMAAQRKTTGSWKGAVAAWNIGATYAKAWVDAGYPAKGGPIMGTDPATGLPIFAYERATNYWNYVSSLPY